MPLLTLSGVLKAFGPDIILEDVTFTLQPGERLAIVGRNGAGKSTLFRLILGEDSADEGQIAIARDVRIGHLSQAPELDANRTVLAETLDALEPVRALERELRDLEARMAAGGHDDAMTALATRHAEVHDRFEHLGGYEIESRTHTVLAGLGVPNAMLTRECGRLSGGERSRVALARLLLTVPDILLLDEPTNHLDLDGIEWLEDFLNTSPSAAIVVSHDRRFLDRTCPRTLEILDCRGRVWPGPYSTFSKLKAEDSKALLREVRKQQDFIEKERAFIRRHIGSQRSREAAGRRKRLERLELLTPPPGEESSMKPDFTPARPQGRSPLVVADVTARFGDRILFQGLSFELAPGERLGIVGANGTGKSTLLGILGGRIAPASGKVDLGRTVDLGWFDQHHERLVGTITPYATIHDARPQWTNFQVRSWLARFLFGSDDLEREIPSLSGGERARLAIARLLLDRPNMLFLDEPTNHLDIPSREALEEALLAYTGTLIAVSHDRWFLDRVVQKILWIDPAGVRLYQGTWSEALVARRAAASARQNAAAEARDRPKAADVRRPPKADAAAKKRRPIGKIEAEIMEAEERKKKLNAALEDPAVWGDGARVREVNAELSAVAAQLARLEAEWSEYA